MKLNTDQAGSVSIVRVAEARVMYPMLGDFSGAVAALVAAGRHNIVIDLTPVTYIDSAAIGCLMDLYRQATQAKAILKLAGVQRRVETMLTLVGANQFMDIYADAAAAVKSF